MPIAIVLASLASRATRIASVGSTATRIIATSASSDNNDDDGNFISKIYNGVIKFGKGLMQKLFSTFSNILKFDWGTLWAQITRGVVFLLNFNWNISDADLDAQIKQAEIGLASAQGTLVGTALGYAICGAVPAATVAVFNQPLALYMMAELGEEAADEIADSLTALVSLQLQQFIRIGFSAIFKNYRSLLRGAAIGVAQILVAAGVLSQDSVDKANKNRNEPWSIASALEETIEDIDNPVEQAYAEEFWDSFGEACIEAGFIIANSADSFFAMQKMSLQAASGSERVIEIQPNRSIPTTIQ